MWGRTLGIYFALPLVAFASGGYLTRRLSARLGLLFAAGASQGFVARAAGRARRPPCHPTKRQDPNRGGHAAGLVDGQERAGAAAAGARHPEG